jgi:hypothetical protein
MRSYFIIFARLYVPDPLIQTLNDCLAGSFEVNVAVPLTDPGFVGVMVTVKLAVPPGAIVALPGPIVIVALFAFVIAAELMIRFCVVVVLFAIVMVALPGVPTGIEAAGVAQLLPLGDVMDADGGIVQPTTGGLIVKAFDAVSVHPVSTFR